MNATIHRFRARIRLAPHIRKPQADVELRVAVVSFPKRREIAELADPTEPAGEYLGTPKWEYTEQPTSDDAA